MKRTIKSTLALIGITAGLASAAFAQAPAAGTTTVHHDANGNIVVMPPYSERSDMLQPVETVPITVRAEDIGQPVEMVFWVDKNGRPYNIDADTTNMPDRYTNVKTASLVTQIRVALEGWKFAPAHDASGNPVERQVRLPINFSNESTLASSN